MAEGAPVIVPVDTSVWMEYPTFVRATDLYRALRGKGVTVRRPVDCIIAATAIEHDALLLHNDRDFDPIEKHGGLKVLHAPGGPRRV
jgi:predicted nucleic acid-binding protein